MRRLVFYVFRRPQQLQIRKTWGHIYEMTLVNVADRFWYASDTGAEDRALRGRNLSADPGSRPKGRRCGGGFRRSVISLQKPWFVAFPLGATNAIKSQGVWGTGPPECALVIILAGVRPGAHELLVRTTRSNIYSGSGGGALPLPVAIKRNPKNATIQTDADSA